MKTMPLNKIKIQEQAKTFKKKHSKSELKIIKQKHKKLNTIKMTSIKKWLKNTRNSQINHQNITKT